MCHQRYRGTWRDVSFTIITDNLEVTHLWCNRFCLLMLLCKYNLLQTTRGREVPCVSASLEELTPLFVLRNLRLAAVLGVPGCCQT